MKPTEQPWHRPTTHPREAPSTHSRHNHYVPEWYQVDFAAPGTHNWLLDLSSPRLRPDGSPILARPHQRAPKSCFWEEDLYVTRLGPVLNDEVETILFQGIDDFGAKAVRAFIDGDLHRVHTHFQALFDYLGAQRLRTPKGLEWIRSRYPVLDQVGLLTEMQQLRQMFGTVWIEAVHEIVSAKDSEVKFLISDHPVTTFNATWAAGTGGWPNLDEPNLMWNGTQTIFALDADHCLILTHVPYAQDPETTVSLRRRINARHFGAAMGRIDTIIRTRQLSADEVIAINHVLKQRARRYIAAGTSEWLYPERQASFDLAFAQRTLLPPKRELWHYGGEIYFGYEDGSSGYRDAHGRTSKEHTFVAKVVPSEQATPDQECPCGSGEAFAACCRPKATAQRPPWDVLSVRERNLTLIRAVVGILELDQGKSWAQVRRELSDEQVMRLHRLVQALWPEDTDLTQLMPAPGDGRSRAIYVGVSDPRTVQQSVVGLVPLFDQILVLNPFLNPRLLAEKFNPLKEPTAFRQQLLKNVAFLLTLAPLIEANKVVLFPDPGELNFAFGHTMRTMAESRTAGWTMRPEHREEQRWLLEDDERRAHLQLPDEALTFKVKKSSPHLSHAEVAQVVSQLRQQAEEDPFALLQPAPFGESGAHFLILRGVNLELALYMAQLTGATPVTDSGPLWEHLQLHTQAALDLDGQVDPTRFVKVPYRAYLHPDDALAAAHTPAAGALRAAVRNLQSPVTPEAPQAQLRAAGAVFAGQSADLGATAAEPRLVVPLHLMLSMPRHGFASASAQRLSVAFGRDQPPIPVPLAIYYRVTDEAVADPYPGFGKPPRLRGVFRK